MEGIIKLFDKDLGFSYVIRKIWGKRYNEDASLSQNRNRVLAVLSFMLIWFNLNAQLWKWEDCVDWFENSGVELLCIYAHPSSDVLDYSILQTSPDIIVEYELEGFLSTYKARYKIVHGYSSDYGMHYFKDVTVLKDEDPISPFNAWNDIPKFHPVLYRKAELYHLYGPREFDDIQINRTKAAVALMLEFLVKWIN